MIYAPESPWLSRLLKGVEKIEQRFMPIFVVGGVTVGSGILDTGRPLDNV